MSLVCCSCQCGSVDSLIRNFLQGAGYKDWLTIPIIKGKEASRSLAQSLSFPEAKMLDSFLAGASKWAVVLGYNDATCRWSDIAHANPKILIEAEFVVKEFA